MDTNGVINSLGKQYIGSQGAQINGSTNAGGRGPKSSGGSPNEGFSFINGGAFYTSLLFTMTFLLGIGSLNIPYF